MSAGWENGSTREWRKIRGRVLKRDSYRCQLRIEGVCKVRADCVHHLHGRAVTGDNPAYLVASCTPCNLHVGDPNRSKKGKPPANPAPRPRTAWLPAVFARSQCLDERGVDRAVGGVSPSPEREHA